MAGQEKAINWSKLHPWMKMAHEHARTNQSYYVLSVESPEFVLWLRYFQGLSWAPAMFEALIRIDHPRNEWTAPCQFPEWLPDFGRWKAEQKRLMATAAE